MPGYPRPSHVAGLTLGEVAASVGVDAPVGDAVTVTGITHDSAMVQSGDLYAALTGARRHGAEFAGQARERGAVAVLTDRAGASLAPPELPVLVVDDPRAVLGVAASAVYGHPTRDLTVIGITGTAGKTTAAYLVESGLAAAGRTTCMIGTVETRIAGLTISSVRTTPEATDLQALFAVARERGADAAVMEVSSHALAYGRADGVAFDIGAFTNFGLDHLDFHTDVDDYFAAKARLFDGRCRVEVLNWDDPAVRRLVRAGRVTFSATGDPEASWRAEKVGADTFGDARGAGPVGSVGDDARGAAFGQHFLAIGPGGVQVPARVALPGRHNVANALLALACLVGAGIDPATAAAGIGACNGVPGRLERVPARGPVLGVVDYAHKPDAIVAALGALRGVGELATRPSGSGGAGRLICVIGAGGDRDAGKRPMMGAAAAGGADIVVITDDNPRSEDPAAIRAAVLAGATAAGGSAGVVEVAGRRNAIAAAVALAEPGDVVALLGKGHDGQETAGTVEPFDDRVELAAALNARFADDGAGS